MKKLAAVVLLTAAVAAPALAADNGLYIGAKAGRTHVGFNALTKSTDNTLAWFVGYQLNRNFAAEAEFVNLGNFTTAAAATGKTNVWALSAMGFIPVSDSISLYGKLGIARSSTNGIGADTNRVAATYGLGGQYNVTPAFGIRFGWDQYAVGIPTQRANDSTWTVAGALRF